uniref:Uncharacterized protein n=1 Tax=Tanacetum cinerariifolium TaxID=118510 RepID=A0A699GKF4_TANCI|nr:hypothetical protein [Tanacetum cinerariifolium]
MYHDLYLGGKVLVERESINLDVTKSDLCPSFVKYLAEKGMDLHMADSHIGNHHKDDFTPLKTIKRFLSIFGSGSLSSSKGNPSSQRGREPVLSSCIGRFHYEDGTAKNRATVLAGSIPLHWLVPLSALVNFLIGKVLPTLADEIKQQENLRAHISHSLKIYLLISKHH